MHTPFQIRWKLSTLGDLKGQSATGTHNVSLAFLGYFIRAANRTTAGPAATYSIL